MTLDDILNNENQSNARSYEDDKKSYRNSDESKSTISAKTYYEMVRHHEQHHAKNDNNYMEKEL